MIELIQGDCLIEMDFIDSRSVDLVLTDPPYGTTACKWDSIIPLEPMWRQLKRIIKPNGAVVLFGSEPFSSLLVSSNLQMFKYNWIWNKVNKFTGALTAKKMPMLDHEILSVFYDNQPIYNRQLRKGQYTTRHTTGNRNTETMNKVNIQKDVGRRVVGLNPKRILDIPSQSTKKSLHPTQKPLALMAYLIQTYTNVGDTVLDFTMGSGTTGVECKLLNRNFIGIESGPKYFKTAKERIEETKVKTIEEELEDL